MDKVFTREVCIDCYERAKVKKPKTRIEYEYNKSLDRKIKKWRKKNIA